MKTRFRGIDDTASVHISRKEIDQRFFPYPAYNIKNELAALVNSGQLEITPHISQTTGHKMFNYNALLPGALDLYMVKSFPKSLDPDLTIMRDHLMRVSLPHGAPSTAFFSAFLKFRNDLIDLFFSVCDFANRVHTPVTNFHRTHRPNLLLDGRPTIGLDVCTMQPLLLGRILKDKIGNNQYSTWIDSGEDIYIMLQKAANLESRDQSKKRFFEILFAPPNNDLVELFGSSNWIRWINDYKNVYVPGNPHSRHKRHSNLAWLLQTTEVKTMRKVWHSLNQAKLPFLSVHDEIIVKESDSKQVETLFRQVFDHEFSFYKLNIN
jgi:hypothetical protein